MGVAGAQLAVAIVLVSIASAPPSTPSPTEAEPAPAAPELELRPAATDFGAVEVGDEDDRTVDIVNVGAVDVTLGAVTVTGPGFSIRFNNCSGEPLERGEACGVTVLFEAPDTGTFEGGITLDEPVALAGDLVGVGLESSLPTTVVPTSGPLPTTNGSDAPSTAVPTTGGGGVPTTVPQPPPDELRERLAQCERDAAEAEVGFSPALEMVVDDVTDVAVHAVIGEGPVLTAGSGPPITVVPAALRCEVEATLSGQHFDIDPPGPQAASFIDRPTVEWRWQVTPTRAGDHTLHVRIVPIAQSETIRLTGTPALLRATISVEAAPKTFWQRADDVARGIGGHPLVTGFGALAAIVAVLAAGWRWVLRRPWPWKRPDPPPRAPPGGCR